MNFVIFSYHFLPMAGAESYCTTRFASALAAAGHDVTVVTMGWPCGVSDAVVKKLVDDRLKIIRVPIKMANKAPVLSRLRYLTHEWEAVNLTNCIAVLKKVLKGIDHPILVSRTHPISSLIVAWHCRKLAAKWVAHLSDPIPFFGGKLKRDLMRFWCRRAFRDADRISVTCDNAVRFYRDEYGCDFDENKCVITPHIGDPWLASDEIYSRFDDLPTIVHTGLFYAGRGARPLLSAIKTLNDSDCPCRFIQVGEVDASIKNVFKAVPNVLQLDNLSPSLSTAVVESSDVSFVSDVQLAGDYIPYMPSKFAYHIFTDKPIVVFSKKDSPMGHYCVRYPNSALFFADSDRPETLADALRLAVLAASSRQFDRVGLREDFTASRVAERFAEVCR